MNIPTGLLESIFENRDGAALTLTTARAKVTITRMESDHGPTVYRLSGDTAALYVKTDRDHKEPITALADALAILEAYSENT